MATARRSAGPTLGEFLTALRSRLDALPPEGVAAFAARAVAGEFAEDDDRYDDGPDDRVAAVACPAAG